jgi:hypothetical protein
MNLVSAPVQSLVFFHALHQGHQCSLPMETPLGYCRIVKDDGLPLGNMRYKMQRSCDKPADSHIIQLE